MGQRSLDEFVSSERAGSDREGTETAADATADPRSPGAGEETTDSESEPGRVKDPYPDGFPEDVDPALATATFDPAGATCVECGVSIDRLWREGEAMVCGECKDW